MGKSNIYATRVTLLEKLRDKHDDHAWRDFVYFYRGFIYSLTRSMGLSHHDGEEVVQLVLLKTWNKLPEFEYNANRGRFRNWLGRVVSNSVRNYIRDNSKGLVPIENEDGIAVNEEKYLSNQSEIDILAEREWQEYLPKLAWENISDNFGEKFRKVYEMMQQEKSVGETAEALDLAESSVYVYRKRIREKLKAEITRLERELG